ncbi:MAG: MASE1 domain-containing protein, partial [Phycicoccus sp.]
METREDRAGRSAAVRRPVLIVALVSLGYGLGATCSWVLFEAGSVAVFFPAAGVTVAALLLTGRRDWPWVLGAAAVTEVLLDSYHGQALPLALGFAAANTLEPLTGALLVRRWRSREIDLTRRADAILFIGAAVLAAPLVGATVGASTLGLGTGAAWLTTFGPFWAGDALGVLTVGAAIVAWPRWSARQPGPIRLRGGTTRPVGQYLAVLAAVAVVTVVAFWSRDVPLAFLPVPLLALIASWGGVSLVAGCGGAMAVAANAMSSAGYGPWALVDGGPATALVALQIFLALAVVTAWILAVEVCERERTGRVLRQETQERRQVQALQEVTAGLAAAVTSDDVNTVVVARGVGLVAEYGVVAQLDDERTQLRLWYSPGMPEAVTALGDRVPAGDAERLPLAAAVADGRVIQLTSLDEIRAAYPGTAWTHTLTATNSLLVLPVAVRGVVLGAIAFGFRA